MNLKSSLRTIVVLALAAGLLGVFLYHVDLRRVGSEIAHAQPEWLVFSFSTMLINLAIRAYRWQYLLDPVGKVRFSSAFRATAVGFAASAVLPARAGEVIRPYFLARDEHLSATGAFATIILERLLDVVAVLVLLAAYVFVSGSDLERTNPVAYGLLKWAGGTASAGALAALVILFVLAGHPERLGRATKRLAAFAPSFSHLIAGIAERFARGLGAIRSPRRLLVAVLWSFPLWLSIAAGIWAVAIAFRLAMPFTGSFLIIALLVLSVAVVPTPGAIGGFHAAFRYGATTFFGAADDAAVGAAIVLHVLSMGPSLLLGLYFAAQVGVNLTRMRELAVTAPGDAA
jgi:glycosyltransferase 2 family protein